MAKKILGKGIENIFKEINENKLAKNIPKGLDKLFGVEEESLQTEKKELLDRAIEVIDHAEKGILIDQNGKIIENFNSDLSRMQIVFDSVENKRVSAFVGGRSTKGGQDIRISSQDIKAVLFKPIIELKLDHPDLVESGRSQFRAIWNLTKSSLYEDLENITEEKLKNAIEDTHNEIRAFRRYVLSYLSNNPKEWNEFIDAILDEIPTAFGNPSP